MGDDDPFGSYGLSSITIENKPAFDLCFGAARVQLSDYSFANTFIWRDSIHLRWRVIRDCLCVFANGDGGLTMLFPPLGPGDPVAALQESMRICDAYNADNNYDQLTRVEYVSDDLLGKLSGEFTAVEMSGDYVYTTAAMIDLPGGDLASKRQARNRFARRYDARIEPFDLRHLDDCLALLGTWQQQSVESPSSLLTSVCIKRAKEVLATTEAIRHSRELGLRGMVLYVGDRLVGFTFGEQLAGDTCSILIEKTDREYVGSANYIFSEFCRQYWSHTRLCNVGDDWEIPTLAWTKQSYRPIARLRKWVLRPVRAVSLPAAAIIDQRRIPPVAAQFCDISHPAATQVAASPCEAPPAEATGAYYEAEQPCMFAPAGMRDLNDLVALESQCFEPMVAFTRRQWRYLLACPRASAHVVRQGNRVIGEAMLLRRRTRKGLVARVYSIAVDPACRGKGVGKMLLRSCLDLLRQEKIPTVFLEVDVANERAVALYESFGFRRVKRLRNYYAIGSDGWKMQLGLNDPQVTVAATASDNPGEIAAMPHRSQ